MLLRRYKDVAYIFSMELPEFSKFVKLAKAKEEEEKIRGQWVALLPYMSVGMLKYMSFSKYADAVTGKNIDLRPTDEIIRDIEETHRKAHEKG